MGIFKIIGGIFCTLLAIAAVTLMVIAGLEFGGIINWVDKVNLSTTDIIITEVLLFTMLQVNIISVYLFGFKNSVTRAIVKKSSKK